jgi:hypothetical protein
MDITSLIENDKSLSKKIFYIYKGNSKYHLYLQKCIAYKNKNIKEPKKFICPFKNCQKSYTLKNVLLAHLRTHYGIKPFVCSYCNKSFNEKGNLKTHVRIHTGERPFKCKKCNKGFKALGQLKDHLISHTGFKPFQCPYCQKFYRRKEILKNHVIIHAKDPYFQNNQHKFNEILNNVKKMKNIMHDFDSSDSLCKGNLNDFNINCSISSNENSKQTLNSIKSTISSNNPFTSSNEEKKTNMDFLPKSTEKKQNKKNKIYLIEKVKSKSNCLINDILKENYYSNWPLNDIISNAIDFSLKEESNNIDKNLLNFEKNDISFQKMPEMAEKEIGFSLKFKNNDFTLNTYNKEQNINNNENEINEYDDCHSKMTDCFQEYDSKKAVNYLINY